MKQLTSRKTASGISLVEVIVALFVFAVIMLAITTAFSGAFRGYRNARALQKNIEAADFMINSMAKTLRTSSVWSSSSTSIRIFDHSTSLCQMYIYNTTTGRLEWKKEDYVAKGKAEADCLAETFPDGALIVNDRYSQVNFVAVPSVSSDFGAGTRGNMGRVTVRVRVCSSSNCNGAGNEEAVLQTTVSLRDYGSVNLY